MAHHGRTPQSVLEAPVPTFWYKHLGLGFTRRERRNPLLVVGLGEQARLEADGWGPNVPYIAPAKAAPTRRKARAAANRALRRAWRSRPRDLRGHPDVPPNYSGRAA